MPESGRLTGFPRGVSLLVGFAIVLGLLIVGRDFLLPLVMAGFIVVLANDAGRRLSRITVGGRRLPHWLARALGFLAVVAIMTGFAYFISVQADEVSAQVPTYVERFSVLAAKLQAGLGERMSGVIQDAFAGIDLSGGASALADYVGGVFSNLGLTLLYAAFLFAERGAIPGKIAKIAAGPQGAKNAAGVFSAISEGTRQYVWVKTVVSLLTGGLSYVVLKLVGVDFAEFWVLIIFALNFIPMVGSAFGAILPTIQVAVQFGELQPLVIVGVTLAAIQFVVGNFIEPMFAGRSLNLSPLAIMVALTFWGTVWGAIGMLLSVPITVVILIVCAHIPQWNWAAILLSKDGELMPSEQGEPQTASGPADAESGHESDIEGLRKELDALKSAKAGAESR